MWLIVTVRESRPLVTSDNSDVRKITDGEKVCEAFSPSLSCGVVMSLTLSLSVFHTLCLSLSLSLRLVYGRTGKVQGGKEERWRTRIREMKRECLVITSESPMDQII